MALASLATNEPRELTPEESFRELLKDVVPVIEHMGLVCETLEDAVGMLKLALKNDGQLSILMNLMAEKK